MGLMDFLGSGPLSEKKVQKIVKLATNPFAQPDVRVREMTRLIEDGGEAALNGLLRRFAVNSNGHIADEDEKKWLEGQLVEIGNPAIFPLQRYICSEKQLTYALRAYRRLVDDEEAVRMFIEALQKHGPESYREVDAKLQLVWQLSEDLDDPRVLSALIPFLKDHSDDIRWAVMDLVTKREEEGQLGEELRTQVAGELSDIIFDDTSGPRIARRAAEIMSANTWKMLGEDLTLPLLLGEDYFIDKKRYLRVRAKRNSLS